MTAMNTSTKTEWGSNNGNGPSNKNRSNLNPAILGVIRIVVIYQLQ